MIAVDTNILVYAHREDSPFHAACAATVERLAQGRRAWAIPWPCVHEFYSVVTHASIYSPPSTPDTAIDQLDAWSESPKLRLIGERSEHLDRLAALARSGHLRGPKIHDARIAAICLDHGVEYLVSMDRDFSRFPTLTTRPPQVDSAQE